RRLSVCDMREFCNDVLSGTDGGGTLTDHPTPSEIDRLVRGTLSGAGRRRLVTHLLHGCPRCARLLAPAIALTPRTPPAARLPLAPLAAAPADGYERPVARACAAAVRRFREIRNERQAAAMAGMAE